MRIYLQGITQSELYAEFTCEGVYLLYTEFIYVICVLYGIFSVTHCQTFQHDYQHDC
jgi:hypothetical protein